MFPAWSFRKLAVRSASSVEAEAFARAIARWLPRCQPAIDLMSAVLVIRLRSSPAINDAVVLNDLGAQRGRKQTVEEGVVGRGVGAKQELALGRSGG